jgi:heme/copper-type cytochrome/quinol oxidase subunit 1
MKFRLPPSFRNSKTVRLHSFAFALLAIAGMAITTFFRVYTVDFFYRDHYWPVAIGHLVLAAATLFGVFAVGWTIFQALSRRGLHERMGQIHFWLTLAGILLFVGCLSAFSVGMDRSAESAQGSGMLTMYAMLFTLAGQIVFPVAVVMSWFRPLLHSPNQP